LVPLSTENKVYNTTLSGLFSISNRVWCGLGKKKFHHITPTKMTYSLVQSCVTSLHAYMD